MSRWPIERFQASSIVIQQAGHIFFLILSLTSCSSLTHSLTYGKGIIHRHMFNQQSGLSPHFQRSSLFIFPLAHPFSTCNQSREEEEKKIAENKDLHASYFMLHTCANGFKMSFGTCSLSQKSRVPCMLATRRTRPIFGSWTWAKSLPLYIQLGLSTFVCFWAMWSWRR